MGQVDIRQQTISGIIWSGLTHIGQQATGFVIAVIISRLLAPEDFGLISMITVFSGFAGLFSEFGFGSALIHKQDIGERHLSSVFWINVGVGLLLTVIVAASSPLIASFYNRRILLPLTVAISFDFVIGSMNVVQNALLSKEMDFRRMAKIKIVSIAAAGLISVGMALSGLGVWSLVANSLLITTFSVVMMWRLSNWRPKFIWDSRAIKELFGFSMNLFGFRTLNYWSSNIDNLLVGKYVSAAALGVYGRAYNLMLLPITQISSMLSQVMFPALSTIQNDKNKVKLIFLRANRAIALISFPMMMGLLVVAESFVLAIYGEKWESVVPILQIFCLEGMGRSIMTTVGWIFLSQGRTDIMFRWGLASGIVRLITIIIGLHWGAIGVATAIVLTSYGILWYPAWLITGRLINMTFGDLLNSIKGPFYCSVGMALAVLAFGFIVPARWPHWARLATQVSFGITIYALLVHFFKIRAYQEVRELAIEQWQSRFRGPEKIKTPPK